MTVRIKVGDETREYATMVESPEYAAFNLPHKVHDGESEEDRPDWHWDTPCGKSEYDHGYKYGCEHLDCAIKSCRYGVVAPEMDKIAVAVGFINPALLIVALFVHPLLAVSLFVSNFIAGYLGCAWDNAAIKRDLKEFGRSGTIGGRKAELIIHHTGNESDHYVPKDFPLWMRLMPHIIEWVDTLAVFFWIFLAAGLVMPRVGELYWPDIFRNFLLPLIIFNALAFEFHTGFFANKFLKSSFKKESDKVQENFGKRQKEYPADPNAGREYFELHYPKK